MSKHGRRVGSVALVSALALGGCAPVVLAGGQGMQVGLTPGGVSAGLSSCALGASPTAAGLSASAAVRMSALRQHLAALTSRLQLGSRSAPAQQASWKRVAEGGC